MLPTLPESFCINCSRQGGSSGDPNLWSLNIETNHDMSFFYFYFAIRDRAAAFSTAFHCLSCFIHATRSSFSVNLPCTWLTRDTTRKVKWFTRFKFTFLHCFLPFMTKDLKRLLIWNISSKFFFFLLSGETYTWLNQK